MSSSQPGKDAVNDRLQPWTDADSTAATFARSSRLDAPKKISAVEVWLKQGRPAANIIVTKELCSAGGPLFDGSKDIYIFPRTFKEVNLRFSDKRSVKINVPNITFRELKVRLEDGKDDSELRFLLQYWDKADGNWKSRTREVKMEESVWPKPNVPPYENEVVLGEIVVEFVR